MASLATIVRGFVGTREDIDLMHVSAPAADGIMPSSPGGE